MELVGPASFNAPRTDDWTYVEYFNGERELYDLQADPQQLQNVVTAAEPLLLDQLSRRLAELANCAAANCREIEDLPVSPEVGRASGRERVCQYVSNSGVAESLKNKTNQTQPVE